MNKDIKLSIYLNELMYKCNSFGKGFIFLLTDNEYFFDTYSGIEYKKSLVNELIEKFGYDHLTNKKQRYFFTHTHMFFEYNKQFSTYDKNACILSSIAAYVDNPLDYIIVILNRSIKNPLPIIRSLKSQRFKILYDSQTKEVNNQFKIKNYKEIIDESNFDKNNKYLYTKIINDLETQEVNNIFHAIDVISTIYENILESNSQLPEIQKNTLIDKTTNDSSTNDFDNHYNSNIDETDEENNINDLENIMNKFFNPAEEYVTGVYNKYKILNERINSESRDCRILKTILYIMTYVLKDKDNKDFNPAKYMNNLINSDIGWAVGDENNKSTSFYGNSDLAKFIYGYYPYMTGKENPYTSLINNKIVADMDYNAIMINNFFKENGLSYMGIEKNQLNDFYNLLVRVRDIIKIIDSPISLTGTYNNFIAGIVSSILNSVAMMLDFNVSSIVKTLFYVPIIPIGDKRYSIANVYNYLNFIKMIIESSGEMKNLDHIDRDEFVNCAYDALGINKETLKKIGYLAYNQELNDLYYSINTYDEKLFKNNNGQMFILRNDLKLLYSLIQFSIQKKAFLNGDNQYEYNFLFGDEIYLNNILKELTDVEIYYIFSIYNINMWKLDDNLGSLSEKDVFNFNNKLLFIDSVYDHHNIAFYKSFRLKNHDRIKKEMNDYNFTNTKYEELINNMLKIYKKVLKYNKKQLDNIVFESNDITDIDDFLVRFLPSIIEILKLFNQETTSLKKIAELIDKILLTISEVLFQNLFLKIKIDIQNFVQNKTEEMYKKLSIKDDSESFETTIQANLGSTKFVQVLDDIIKAIETNNFNLFSIQNCFNGNNLTSPIYNDQLVFDDLIYNHGHNTISKDTFIDNEILDDYFTTHPEFIKENDKNDVENKEDKKNNINKIDTEIIKPSSLDDNKKIFYDEGDIKIEKNDGTIITIISKNDKDSINFSYIEYPDIVEKNLSKDEYKQLIEIRDYIDNITNKELLSLNKQLNETKTKLKFEMNKAKPNYSIIQNLNKTIQKLTSMINDVKKENRILTTENNKDTVVIKDFIKNTSKSSENVYSTLDSFFKNKKEILKEVNNIAINNEVVLTNYQITELLK